MNDLERFWENLIQDHPTFDREDDANITLKIRGLKKLIDKAIEEGYTLGLKDSKSFNSKYPKTNSMPDFFKDIFK